MIKIAKKLAHEIVPENIIECLNIEKNKSKAVSEAKETNNYNSSITKERLKKSDKKIKVVFIVYFPSSWNSLKSVFEYMQKNGNYSAYILAQPHITDGACSECENPSYSYLFDLYGEAVINAFCNNAWFDLKAFQPDYVFYTRPYNYEYYQDYLPSKVRAYAKCCWISYAYFLENRFDHNFNFLCNYDFLQNLSFVFCCNHYDESILKKRFSQKKQTDEYPVITYQGFPRFDLANHSDENREKPTVLWTPRWTSQVKKNNKQSSFLRFIDDFIAFAKNHREMDFIMRPHPLMFSHYKKEKLIPEDYDVQLKSMFSALGNITLDENPDYLPSVFKSDIIISDYTSLLSEYLFFGKKIIYTDTAKGFNYVGKAIVRACYCKKNWNEIITVLEELLQGADPKFELRKTVKEKYLMLDSSSSAAENIVLRIKNDWENVW